MKDNRAVDYQQVIPAALQAMSAVHETIDGYGLDRTIQHIVQLRASQLNACGFCVKMHTREAREDGETSERLDRVIVWDQVSDFTEREKAALAWTEALTILNPHADLGEIRSRLRRSFSEQEIGALTAAISMINLWNRINVSRH